MQCPKTKKQLQLQLECFNYFSRFIKNYSRLSAQFYKLLSKSNKKFVFKKEKRLNWLKLKEALKEDFLSVHFDPIKEIKLVVDASDLAVGGIILQKKD